MPSTPDFTVKDTDRASWQTKVNTKCGKCYEISEHVFINIGNSIRKGHFITVAIIMTYKYMHLGLGSRCSGEWTLD